MSEKVINSGNLHLFAYTNEQSCKNAIKGIVLEFHGLNWTGMVQQDTDVAKMYALSDILYVFPYCGPWSWMNDTAIKTVDEIIDVAIEKHKLDNNIPIISTGGSMGGLSSLVYTRYAKRTPNACAANCPVCDLPYHYTEREDLPRTLYHAFSHYNFDFEEALKSASPLHLVGTMPDIPYYIVHGDADMAVNKGKHSDKFVSEMKKNHNIKYNEVHDMGHCNLQGENIEKYYDFILSFIK